MHLFTHPDCLLHDPEPAPGFAPARLRAVMQRLQQDCAQNLIEDTAPPASAQDIALIHCTDYIEKVLAPIPPDVSVPFDFETNAMSGTAAAALASAGLVLKATHQALASVASFAFCAVSPGGHHAEADNASGYCFFNHVALAALTAQKKHGAKRIAVLDFDAHHGNGTQSFFWGHPDLFYVSLHEDLGLSGFSGETGGWNNILNLPLPCASGGPVFQTALTQQALPAIERFAPDLVLLSAGFDMHKDDPLSSLCLETSDYGWLGKTLRSFVLTLGKSSCVAVLEGGYHLEALAASASAFCQEWK